MDTIPELKLDVEKSYAALAPLRLLVLPAALWRVDTHASLL